MGRLTGYSALASLLALGSSCGPGDGASDGRLLPLDPGARWEYRLTDGQGRPGARTVRVVGEDLGQILLETRQDATRIQSWVRADALILTTREEIDGTIREYHPGALRALPSADLHNGQVIEHSWREGLESDDPSITSSWMVEGRETLDVDAGRFHTIRFRRSQTGQPDTRLWFAPGVGLVRAESEDERLILVHWVVP